MKKLLSVISAMAVMLAMGGCESKEAEQVSETVAEMVTVAPPENGWTLEQLNEAMYICDKKIEMPLTYGFLETIVAIEDITYFENMNSASAIAKYNNEYAFSVAFHYNSKEIDDNTEVKNLVFSAELNESEISNVKLIYINGVGLGTSQEKMIKNLGNPTEQSDTMSTYDCGEYNVSFRIDENKKIDFITILLEA